MSASTSRALRVGLTGGIGSGKSTVAAVWSELGAHVVSADQLARDVVAPGTDGLTDVVAAFGTAVLASDGSLDRRALAEVVFADPSALERLESITHPRIAAAARDFFSGLSVGNVGVYDVPLLVENRMASQFDVVVVVEAPYSVRLERLEQRGLMREDVAERMAVQATDDERRAVADVVIDNSGSVADLEAQARRVFAELTAHQ